MLMQVERRVNIGRKKKKARSAMSVLYHKNSSNQETNDSRQHHLATRQGGSVLKLRALGSLRLVGRDNGNP